MIQNEPLPAIRVGQIWQCRRQYVQAKVERLVPGDKFSVRFYDRDAGDWQSECTYYYNLSGHTGYYRFSDLSSQNHDLMVLLYDPPSS